MVFDNGKGLRDGIYLILQLSVAVFLQEVLDVVAGFLPVEAAQPGLDHKHIGIKGVDGLEQCVFRYKPDELLFIIRGSVI